MKKPQVNPYTLLIKLPCKVEDDLYRIDEKTSKCTMHNTEFDEYSCQGCEELECDSNKYFEITKFKPCSVDYIFDLRSKFGKTIFLTREEAEQALKGGASE